MKRKLKDKQLFYNASWLFVVLLFSSCRYDHDMFFDTSTQQLKSCNGLIRNIEVSSKDDNVSLFWTGSLKEAPRNINFDSIPKEYEVKTGGLIRLIPFKLKKNTKYVIEKWGSGVPSFTINIWTDSKGKVFKTTHPKCGIDK